MQQLAHAYPVGTSSARGLLSGDVYCNLQCGPGDKITRCPAISHSYFSTWFRGVTSKKYMKCTKETDLEGVSCAPPCLYVGTPTVRAARYALFVNDHHWPTFLANPKMHVLANHKHTWLIHWSCGFHEASQMIYLLTWRDKSIHRAVTTRNMLCYDSEYWSQKWSPSIVCDIFMTKNRWSSYERH